MKTTALLVALVGLAGCGGSGTSISKACADVANARCNKRASCTSAGVAAGAGIVREFGDLATCVARETLTCTNALNAKSQGNTPDLVEQCVPMYATLSCADFLAGNVMAPCVATGPLASGAACAFPGQCSSSYCNGDKNAACGTCGAAPAIGADCSTSQCARGVSCQALQSSTNPPPMMCVAYGLAGAMCNRENPCDFGLSCVGANSKTGTMGSCMAAAVTVGAACDPNSQTAPGCDRSQGLWCNAMSKTCTAIAYAGDTEMCGEGADGNLTECKAGDCFGAVLGANPTPGTCKAKVMEGSSCDTVFGPSCLPPGKCVLVNGTAGVCTLPDGTKC